MRQETAKGAQSCTGTTTTAGWKVPHRRNKTLFVTGTFVGTCRAVGKFTGGDWVPVGHVSGSGAKTLTAPGALLIDETVDEVALECTAFTSGTIVAHLLSLNAQTE